MSDLFSHRCMDGLSPEQQGAKAIDYLLGRVRRDDRLYHLIGLGSQAFDLLTEAHASLTKTDLAELRKSLSSAA